MKKYFLTGIRNIRQRPGYTVINVLGLALGIATCLVIFLVVRYEGVTLLLSSPRKTIPFKK